MVVWGSIRGNGVNTAIVSRAQMDVRCQIVGKSGALRVIRHAPNIPKDIAPVDVVYDN